LGAGGVDLELEVGAELVVAGGDGVLEVEA
jgi:hypothetical protein